MKEASTSGKDSSSLQLECMCDDAQTLRILSRSDTISDREEVVAEVCRQLDSMQRDGKVSGFKSCNGNGQTFHLVSKITVVMLS